MVARPIRAIIIQPDDSFSIRTIEQDLRTLQGIVGGYLQAIATVHATLWMNEEGKLKGLQTNAMATYLWWKLNPIMEAKDTICGPCIVTGVGADNDGEMTPVSDEVIELYERMERVRHEEEGPNGGQAPPAAPTP